MMQLVHGSVELILITSREQLQCVHDLLVALSAVVMAWCRPLAVTGRKALAEEKAMHPGTTLAATLTAAGEVVHVVVVTLLLLTPHSLRLLLHFMQLALCIGVAAPCCQNLCLGGLDILAGEFRELLSLLRDALFLLLSLLLHPLSLLLGLLLEPFSLLFSLLLHPFSLLLLRDALFL